MDLLLDVDVVLDLCTPRMQWSGAAGNAISRCANNGGRLWLYVGSVQAYQYGLARALEDDALGNGQLVSDAPYLDLARRILAEFCKDKHWLAALANEGDVFDAANCGTEQLLRSLDRFEPGSIKLLTRQANVLDAHPDKAVTPETVCAMPPRTSGMGFIDLQSQQDRIRPSLETKLHRVLHHGRYVMGPEIVELEQQLADYVGTKHCIAVSSGTDALLIALMALGIQPGDEVITTPFTFVATAEVIAMIGAVPRFVDIDARTYNIDPNLIEAAIGPKTRAVMPVSLYGQCAAMDAINSVACRHGLPVIEDAAQSFGATYNGRRSCGLSTIGCTSFFPSKPLGGYGDGGACFTDDDALAATMRQVLNHGQDKRYSHTRLGINGRLDSIQAAVLLAKFPVFDVEVQRRAEIGARYSAALLTRGARVAGEAESGMLVPFVEPHNTSVFAQYTVQVDDRDAVQQCLQAKAIPTAVHYPIPLNRQLAYRHYCCSDCTPVADTLAARVVSLPMHPLLAAKDMEIVVDALASCRIA
ncbi:MAG: DegT/DnrJ/EryC1/StrS family aminotransferase [Thiohalocapsa sp.]